MDSKRRLSRGNLSSRNTRSSEDVEHCVGTGDFSEDAERGALPSISSPASFGGSHEAFLQGSAVRQPTENSLPLEDQLSLGTDSILREIAKKSSHGRRNFKLQRGQDGATALAVAASMIASGQLAALLTPSEVIFNKNNNFNFGYCNEFDTCNTWLEIYGISCSLSFTGILLTLLSTIRVAIGIDADLVLGLLLFSLSILVLALALVAACWLTLPASVSIASSIFFFVYSVLSLYFMVPLLFVVCFGWYEYDLSMNKSKETSSRSLKRTDSDHYRRAFRASVNTQLHWAALRGGWFHRQIVQVHLSIARENIDRATSNNEWTALMYAAVEEHTQIMKEIIDAGCNLYARCSEGRTALHWAAYWGSLDAVKVLLAAGADAEAADFSGKTPQQHAEEQKHSEVMDTLEKHVKHVHNNALVQAVKRQDKQKMSLLLECGASENSKDDRGRTCLILAANRGFLAGAKLLLQHGAKVHLRDKRERTAFDEAACMGHREVLKLLLKSVKKNGDISHAPDVVACCANTLRLTSKYGKLTAAKLLLQEGVELTSDALEAAVKVASLETLQALLERYGKERSCKTELQAAAYFGSLPAVDFLLKMQKPEIDAKNRENDTALIFAAMANNNGDVVKRLLQHEPPANALVQGSLGRTALHLAAENGNLEALNAILDLLPPSKSDILTIQDDDGQTALHLAAESGNLEAVKLLLSKSKDKNWLLPIRDKDRRSACDVARLKGHDDIVQNLNLTKG